jgi:hypothetical protein
MSPLCPLRKLRERTRWNAHLWVRLGQASMDPITLACQVSTVATLMEFSPLGQVGSSLYGSSRMVFEKRNWSTILHHSDRTFSKSNADSYLNWGLRPTSSKGGQPISSDSMLLDTDASRLLHGSEIAKVWSNFIIFQIKLLIGQFIILNHVIFL